MMARQMREAVDMEDYKLWQQGRPPRKKVVPVIPQPEQPKVKNLVQRDKIKLDEVIGAAKGRRKVIMNKDGCKFMGFEVSLPMKNGQTVVGWMPEADYIDIRHLLYYEDTVNTDGME